MFVIIVNEETEKPQMINMETNEVIKDYDDFNIDTNYEIEKYIKIYREEMLNKKIENLEKEKSELEMALIELAKKQSEENEYRTQLEVALVELAAKVGGE